MSRTLLTLDVAQARAASSYKLAARNDWRRAGQFLKGSYPEALPPLKTWLNATPHDLYKFRRAPFVVIDTEYQYDPESKRAWDRATRLDLIGFYGPGTPVLQMEWTRMLEAERKEATEFIRDLVGSQVIVFQNTGADVLVLDKFLGIKWEEYGETHDTMYAHAVLWPELPHSLEFLASVYGRCEKLKHLAETDPLRYNAGDVVETANTWTALARELNEDSRTMQVYRKFLLPLRPIILRAEKRGIRINQEFVAEAQRLLSEKANFAVEVAHAYAGYPVNLNSGDQLLPLLATEGLKLKSLKADKLVVERGKFFPVEQGEDLGPEGLWARMEDGAHPLLEARAAFIQADKQLSAYITPLCRADGSVQERVFPHFLPTAQDNGRWSTTDPPLAQLPASLRPLLIPDIGMPWVGWDWSAIELRILAATTRDQMLLDAFANDWDLHTITCCELFGYDLPSNLADPHKSDEDAVWREALGWEGKDDKRRVFAKTFVYRIIYGGDPKGAGSLPGANKLGVPKEELVKGSYRWLDKHPKLTNYWGRLREDALGKGMVRSFLGRRRMLQETDSKRRIRQAYDQPAQAGCSDVLNNTVIQVTNTVPSSEFMYGCHDSAYFGVPLSGLEESFWKIKAIVEQPYDIFGKEMVFTWDPDIYMAPEEQHLRENYNHLVISSH